jgi:hypothetical protein
VFGFSKPGGHASDTVVLTSTTTNSTPTPITGFELQAAVPKVRTTNAPTRDCELTNDEHTSPNPTQPNHVAAMAAVAAVQYITLTLGSPSGTEVPPHGHGAVTQQITLHNSLHGQVRRAMIPS